MSQLKKTTSHHTGRERVTIAKGARANKAPSGVPLIVVYWALGLGFTGYVVSRFVLSTHPLHWASGAGGLLLGVIIGYIWFFTRGDVGLI